MTHDEMIAVIQAHKNGKKIQLRRKGSSDWTPSAGPGWDFVRFDYRVKPEKKKLYAIYDHDGRFVVSRAEEDFAKKDYNSLTIHGNAAPYFMVTLVEE